MKVNLVNMKIKIYGIFFCLFVFCAPRYADGKTSLFTSFERDQKVVHIWGVDHIGFSKQYPVSSEILSLFDQSSVFVNESVAVYLDSKGIAELLKREYISRDGKTFGNIIGESTCKSKLMKINFYENANELLQKVNNRLAIEKFLALSPKAFIHQLYFIGDRNFGEKNQSGSMMNVEYFLGERFRKAGKSLKSLDPEFWLAIESLNDAEICDFIKGIVEVRSDVEFEKKNAKALQSLFSSITRDDAEAVQKHYFALSDMLDNEYSKVHRKWFSKRNEISVSKLIGLINETQGNVFVVVGAAHIAGENGILALMRKAGFKEKKK